MNGISGIGNAGGVQQILALRQQLVERNELLQQLQAAKPATAAVPAADTTGGFGDALKSALDGVNASQVEAERLSTGYQTGEVTDVAKVMLARQEAGIAFEATLQVRNRLLSAYQDIMRMGV
jgi:flagellar hook-basal body complex protein FliE